MSKSYDGYFTVFNANFEDVDYNLKVENNKIIGATFSAEFSAERDIGPEEIETLLDEVIGEDFRDFVIEKTLNQEDEDDWRIDVDEASYCYQLQEVRNANDLGLSLPDYQKKVASILEKKEKNSTLNKADMITRISQIRNNKGR